MKIKSLVFLCAFLSLTFTITAQLPAKLYNNKLPFKNNAATLSQLPMLKNAAANCDESLLSLAPTAAPCNGVSVTPISFSNAIRTVDASSPVADLNVGVIYRYTGAGTAPDGTVLDALVTVQSYNNTQDTASPTTFLAGDAAGSPTSGFDQNLQPNLNQESTTFQANTWAASINYRIQFVVTGTYTAKRISVATTAIDNDGANACGTTLRESVTFTTPNQYLLSTTPATLETRAGNVITGPTTNQANIGVGADYAVSALYINVTELNWSYSFTTAAACSNLAGASPNRFGSLNMNCQIDFVPDFATVALSGTVFNDTNGLTDSTVNGTGTNAGGLFANLLDSNGFVVASVAVAANGTYSFPNVPTNASYSVQISTNQGVESNSAPADALPAGWVNTGENIGTGAGSDGTVNSRLPVTVVTTAITNVNFGIEQPPTPTSLPVTSRANPGGTNTSPVPATAFTATDPSVGGTVTNIRITAFPSNATTITIGGTVYGPVAGPGVTAFPAGGVTIPTNAAGNPTQAITVDPINGAVTVVIPYVAIDNAGVESTTTANVSVPFTAAPTAANALISGKLLSGDTPVGGALVVLLNTSTNQKRIVRTDANGIYRFQEVVGNTYIIEPLSNKYAFSPSTKLLNLLEDATEENFVGASKNYRPKNDFDGDGKTDAAVYRASEGNWYVLQSGNNEMSVFHFGNETDIPVSADFDGDAKTDYAVFRPSEGNWYIWQSASQTLRVDRFGLENDKLVPADFDGDGKTDVAVYREGVWYITFSSNGSVEVRSFGLANDKPSVEDFDGDGKADISVYRASEGNWYVLNSSNNSWAVHRFGLAADVQVAGDYDGDGFADIAQFRNGVWYVKATTTDFQADQFGEEGDQSIVGDFDGDGRTDLTVFKKGVWSVRNSGDGSVKNFNFGLSTDVVIK
jgi:hypothetical protein